MRTLVVAGHIIGRRVPCPNARRVARAVPDACGKELFKVIRFDSGS